MSDETDWHAAADRQFDYLTLRLIAAWGDANLGEDMRRVMRRIANSIPTDDQKLLAEAISALRFRASKAIPAVNSVVRIQTFPGTYTVTEVSGNTVYVRPDNDTEGEPGGWVSLSIVTVVREG